MAATRPIGTQCACLHADVKVTLISGLQGLIDEQDKEITMIEEIRPEFENNPRVDPDELIKIHERAKAYPMLVLEQIQATPECK